MFLTYYSVSIIYWSMDMGDLILQIIAFGFISSIVWAVVGAILKLFGLLASVSWLAVVGPIGGFSFILVMVIFWSLTYY